MQIDAGHRQTAAVCFLDQGVKRLQRLVLDVGWLELWMSSTPPQTVTLRLRHVGRHDDPIQLGGRACDFGWPFPRRSGSKESITAPLEMQGLV